jgi:two-component system sensor histidine kinase KdpD
MQETVPDVFDQADEIELIDITPDDLPQRLKEGKVYLPERAQHALENFFRKGNLTAAGNCAAAADRVDAAMREYRDEHAISDTWAAGERPGCVGPDAGGEAGARGRAHGPRHARALARGLRRNAGMLRLPDAERNWRIDVLRLAECWAPRA